MKFTITAIFLTFQILLDVNELDFVSSAKVMQPSIILWQQDGTERCASINPSILDGGVSPASKPIKIEETI